MDEFNVVIARPSTEILLVQMHFIPVVVGNVYVTMNSGLIHWGRVTHIYVSKLTIISSENGLSPSLNDVW